MWQLAPAAANTRLVAKAMTRLAALRERKRLSGCTVRRSERRDIAYVFTRAAGAPYGK
jgi:hypothetical protein